MLAKMFGHIFLDINPTTIKNAKQVMDAAEGDISPSAKEFNVLNKIMKAVLGLGIDEQDPIGGITFKINEFTGYLKKTQTDFKNDARDAQKLIENPFLLTSEFENLQANRYREMNRVYDFVMYLKDGLNLSDGEIIKHFLGRGGFGTATIAMLLRGKFDPANVPPLEWTSMYPQILKRINRTKKYIDSPLKLEDIFDRKEMWNIKSKWANIPMGLNDEQLREYFLTGKDPRLKVEEVIETEDTSMILPAPEVSDTKQVASVKPQVPLNAANVSSEVIASKPDPNVVGSTGLTATETAYLSNEEKAMRLKQKGLA
jgi:hypothetical protein